MKAIFSVFAVLGLVAGATAFPQSALTKKDCHAAYSDVCLRVGNYHQPTIAVQAGTQGRALCIVLGEWEGENPVVLEWNGKYAARKIGGVAGRSNAIAVRVQQGKVPATIKVYSPGSDSVEHHWQSCTTKLASNIENLQWRSRSVATPQR